MNQDNKEFELSGTLGSLSDTALNNLAQQNSNETVTTLENTVVAEENNESEIEMLEVLEPEAPTSLDPVVEVSNDDLELVNSDNLDSSFSTINTEGIDSIPTNFNIGDIGSVPPVDPNGKKDKKSKFLFIILLIIFILAIGALVFYYLRISKGTLSNSVVTKDITIQIGEELSTNINDYATFKSISSNNCILNTKNIDVNKTGNYEYTISCGNRIYKGNLSIKDTVAPQVKTKTIIKKVNEEVLPQDFIALCDEASECTYSFENPEIVTNSITTPGTYEFNLIVMDSSNNVTNAKVKLIVMDIDIKVYVNCVLADQVEEEFDGSVSLINKIAINDETVYAGLYFDIKEYIAKTADEYNRIKNEYTTNKVLKINSGTGTPIFDDNNLTITFEELVSGEVNFDKSYSAIKKHYEQDNNYKCNLVSAN